MKEEIISIETLKEIQDLKKTKARSIRLHWKNLYLWWTFNGIC